MSKKYARTPTVYQMEATECGAASLAMILAYFGSHIPLEKLRIETGVSRDGCNAGNIMKAAKRLGLECHGYRREPEALRKLTPPCIIHWNFNHFVVLEGFRGKHAYLNDPACGRRKLTMEELDEGFTGVVLTFAVTPDFHRCKSDNGTLEFLKERLQGSGSAVAKMVFTGLLLVFPGVVLPVLSQVFMDKVIVGADMSWFRGVILFMAAAVLMQALLSFYRGALLQRLRSKMIMMSGYKFLSKLLRLPIGFFDQRYVGDLTGRADNNVSVCDFLAGDLADTALNIFSAVFFLVLLCVYSPLLTLIACAAAAINLVIAKLGADSISKTVMKQRQDSGRLAGAVCAGLSITGTLKASGAENEYTGRILGYSAKEAVTEQRLNRLQQIISVVPGVVTQLSSVGVLLAGAVLVIRGEFTVGMLLAFNSLYSSFSQPVDQLVGMVQKIQTVRADISRVQDINNYGADPKFSSTAVQKNTSKLEGRVELRDISFGYSTLEKPLVQGLSFRLNSGSSVAFVGPSGCGKSTLMKLLLGFESPVSGKIYYDGKDIESLDKRELRKKFGVVLQDGKLISGSIFENITITAPRATVKDVNAVAEAVGLKDDIDRMPMGLHTVLSEDCGTISGGQQQRILIARAIISKPSILFFDEATSALDNITQAMVCSSLEKLNATRIVIAHRLSTIMKCDRIIVLDSGKIAEQGTFDELMAANGLFSSLASRQI